LKGHINRKGGDRRAAFRRDAVLAACEGDILFSVGSAEGRRITDLLSASLAMPLFDVGVAIPTEPVPGGGRRIAEVYGRVDYV
jgi:hypothetical protein